MNLFQNLEYNSNKMNPFQFQYDTANSIGTDACTVLIAEDDIFSFELMKYLLSETKINLLHAGTGTKAIEILKNQSIDIVFLDLQLPDMNGFDVLKQIRTDNSDIPVIAHTAFIFHKDKEKIINAGFNGLVIKPFSKENIFDILNKNFKKLFQTSVTNSLIPLA